MCVRVCMYVCVYLILISYLRRGFEHGGWARRKGGVGCALGAEGCNAAKKILNTTSQVARGRKPLGKCCKRIKNNKRTLMPCYLGIT